jgi:hypothetical protein
MEGLLPEYGSRNHKVFAMGISSFGYTIDIIKIYRKQSPSTEHLFMPQLLDHSVLWIRSRHPNLNYLLNYRHRHS